MRRTELELPLVAALAATRGMLGAGIGLLAAGRLSERHRHRVGRALLLIGAISTAPLARAIWRRSHE